MFTEETINFNNLLLSREQRAQKQQRMLFEYHLPLICFTLNIPGPNKVSSLFEMVFNEGLIAIRNSLNGKGITIVKQNAYYYQTGYESFLVVNCVAELAKLLMIEIEDTHPLGRIFDIDVLNINSEKISRGELGFSRRTCIVCGNNVDVCRRNSVHSLSNVVGLITELATKYFQSNI